MDDSSADLAKARGLTVASEPNIWRRDGYHGDNFLDPSPTLTSADDVPSEVVAPQPGAVEEPKEESLTKALCSLYTSAYHAGHEATVEGYYTDVFQQDRMTYHYDSVVEWLKEDSDSYPLKRLLATTSHQAERIKELEKQVADLEEQAERKSRSFNL